jgi:hypothetical protein
MYCAIINKCIQGYNQLNLGQDPGDRKHELWQRALPLFDQLKVTVVIGAGNYGDNGINEFAVHQSTPQKLSSDSNSLIMVGGACANGSLWFPTSPQAAGQAGSTSLYAQALDVTTAHNENTDSLNQVSGTSFAAPAVVSYGPVIV